MALRKIISGGQTGVDRGGLDAAIGLGIPHGGFCPQGRLAEDGHIPARYELLETESSDYADRTERNVVAGDGTVLVSQGALTGGSALTQRLAVRHEKPCLHLDLDVLTIEEAAERLSAWCEEEGISVLNVAGPRESGCPGICQTVTELVCKAFCA
ncbi:putative molybdenum carrier protein [Planctomycetota bacterium]